ncbi:MAG: PIG-L family deacetylase [Mycobacteriales bacterium]
MSGDAAIPADQTYTIVFFHAHPDDESLLTGGTMARAAAEGHRVVLVVATGGEAGLTTSGITEGDLLLRRRGELDRAARLLGVASVVHWDYADSGSDRSAPRPGGFSSQPVEESAARLAALLREEQADVLTTYDPVGGYGHHDHVQVHRVGVRAAELAGTPVVLEATVHRELLQRVLRLIGWLPGLPAEFSARRFARSYRPGAAITHRVDVRPYTVAKRAAMAAHVSQAASDEGTRTLQVLLRLPRPVFRAALGREWFVEHSRPPGALLLDDVFASRRLDR